MSEDVKEEFNVDDRVFAAVKIEIPGTDKTVSAGTEGKVTKVLLKSATPYVVEFDGGATLPVGEDQLGTLPPRILLHPESADALGKDIDETPATLAADDLDVAETEMEIDRPKLPEFKPGRLKFFNEDGSWPDDDTKGPEARIVALEKQVRDLAEKLELMAELTSTLAGLTYPQKETTGNGKTLTKSVVILGNATQRDLTDYFNRGYQALHMQFAASSPGVLMPPPLYAVLVGPADEQPNKVVADKSEDVWERNMQASSALEVVEFEPSEEMLAMSTEEVVIATREMRQLDRIAAFDSYSYERAKRKAGIGHGGSC